MCLAVPMLVKAINGVMAEAEVGGVTRSVSVMLTPEVRVGDYVLVHTGYAISAIDEDEAQITLRLLEEMAAAVEEADSSEPMVG